MHRGCIGRAQTAAAVETGGPIATVSTSDKSARPAVAFSPQWLQIGSHPAQTDRTRENDVTEAPTGCGIYAVLEAGPAAGERLAAALAAAGLAAVLIAPAAGQSLSAAEAGPLLDQSRRAGAAALVLDDAQLARALGADGVHLRASDDPLAAYRAAREALGKDGVVGVDAGISRHAAMVLAEAGADYVGFGAPPHLKDRVKARTRRDELIAWWAAIFQVPCVAFDVETREEAAGLASGGADFVAVTLTPELTASAAGALMGDIARSVQAHSTTP
jgi:thiamine-phosphate pyrophosphorylase